MKLYDVSVGSLDLFISFSMNPSDMNYIISKVIYTNFPKVII